MQEILSRVRQHEPALLALLQRCVECESPSGDVGAIERCAGILQGEMGSDARCERLPGGDAGPHLLCTFGDSALEPERGVLALGHLDTVWPRGTLATMPWRIAEGRVWGPGVLDMKAGIVFFVFAMRVLRDLGMPMRRPVRLLLVSDEEVGSLASRAVTERLAGQSSAVLVLEPGTGLQGHAKTARKGIGEYVVTAHGKASHAGVDFGAGVNAIVELAQQIGEITKFTDIERGVTVNPGVIQGGTRRNVVPAEASVEVDIRVPTMQDADLLESRFRALRPRCADCRLTVEGGLNRPPMERSAGIAALFQVAQRLAREIGVDLQESSTGGGSDGNFTAALGIPTLDGIGAVGEGAHARHESILLDRIADRTALLAGLVRELAC